MDQVDITEISDRLDVIEFDQPSKQAEVLVYIARLLLDLVSRESLKTE